jgi:hypothetical protein
MLDLIENIEIAGETCDVQIDEYEPGSPGFFYGHPDTWEPAQPPYLAFTVLHPSTGLPWPELQAAIGDEEAAIENLIIQKIEEACHEA